MEHREEQPQTTNAPGPAGPSGFAPGPVSGRAPQGTSGRKTGAVAPLGSAPPLYGVGGWLAFYLVITGVFYPMTCFQEITGWAEQGINADTLPFLAFFIVMGAFAIAQALLLVNLHRKAALVAKLFIVARLVSGIGFYIALILREPDAPALPLSRICLEVVNFTIWFLYFHRSRRIRNTWPG